MWKHLPNSLTLANVCFGFLAIASVTQENYTNAAVFIFIGIMLDSMDGWTARRFQLESEMGKELDSLADIVTFGAAPAVLLYGSSFSDLGFAGMMLSAAVPVFGAYRLARFNINHQKGEKAYFTGLPITAAGGIIALLTLFSYAVPQAVLSAVTMFLCILMVSSFPIPALKRVPVPKYAILVSLFFISIFAVIHFNDSISFTPWIPAGIFFYIVFMAIFFMRRRRRSGTETNI
ncbi:CDP-diacylglycerol--serine O-phosphatidyltransferase [Alkalicoccus urumqiensis]|uniref:CDP-diacylglycerol--serine O-phosphatidyltransferase n=1 Tax=Alkalicoccus urumqiensis TaxID=1548213 RepID=UPI0015E5A5F6|nr:CDP-diacylglycerol--serine O-phosphatidyltransferase [Alkalicoccus urumqiensis]